MDHNRRLEAIASADPLLHDLPEIHLGGTASDRGHARRRCQQRGISYTKLRIALAYGHHDHHHGMQRWTLLGRRLRSTSYARYERELEGLQLVGSIRPFDGSVLLKTCKWNWALRRPKSRQASKESSGYRTGRRPGLLIIQVDNITLTDPKLLAENLSPRYLSPSDLDKSQFKAIMSLR